MDIERKKSIEKLLAAKPDDNGSLWKAVGNNAGELLAARITLTILLSMFPEALGRLQLEARRIINLIEHPQVRDNLTRIFSEQYNIEI